MLFQRVMGGLVGIAVVCGGVVAQPRFDPPPKRKAIPLEERKGYTPVPVSTVAKRNPTLQIDLVKQYSEIERRWILEDYEAQRAKLNLPIQPDTVAALENVARLFAGDPAVNGPDVLKQLGNKALGAGPVAEGCLKMLRWEQRAHNGPSPTFIMSEIDKLRESTRAPARVALIALSFASCAKAGRNSDAETAAYVMAVDRFVQAVDREDISGIEQQYLAQKLILRIRTTLPYDHAKMLVERIEQSERAPEWIKLVCAGAWNIREAWVARGDGYAGEVSDEGWRGFARHLELAGRKLMKAHGLAPDRPDAAALMIPIAMAGHSDPDKPERYWFDQTIAAQLDFAKAYEDYLWSLRPRWGGSHAAMLAFGEECAEVTREDTFVAQFYIEALIEVGEDRKEHQRVWEVGGVAERCERVLRQLAAMPAYQGSAAYYRSLLAGIATRLGNWTLAGEMLDANKGEFVKRAATKLHLHELDVTMNVRARSDAATREKVLAADKAVKEKDFARALKLLGEAKDAASGRLEVEASVRDIQHRTRVAAGVFGEDWVDVLEPDQLSGWRAWGAEFSVKDGWTSLKDPHQAAMMVFAEPVGSRYQLQAKIRNNTKVASPNAGVIFGYKWVGDGGDWCSLDVIAKSRVAAVCKDYTMSKSAELPPAKPVDGFLSMYDLDISVYDDQVVCRINDKIVYKGPMPDTEEWTPGNQIGIVIRAADRTMPQQVSGLRVRRISEMPPELRSK